MWFVWNAKDRGSWCVTARITGYAVGTAVAFTLCILLGGMHGVPLEQLKIQACKAHFYIKPWVIKINKLKSKTWAEHRCI